MSSSTETPEEIAEQRDLLGKALVETEKQLGRLLDEESGDQAVCDAREQADAALAEVHARLAHHEGATDTWDWTSARGEVILSLKGDEMENKEARDRHRQRRRALRESAAHGWPAGR